mgnify:FL=1
MKLYLGIFKNEDDILAATEASREAGYEIHDVYTPFAVHGLDKAMGLKPTRLTYVCFAFALFGLLFALWLQFWIGSIDWPLNVGGRPFNSLPAYLPVTFELTVLFSGLGVVGAMLFRTKLFPGKSKNIICEGVTDDRFVIAVEETDAGFSPERLTHLWKKFNVAETREVEEAAE